MPGKRFIWLPKKAGIWVGEIKHLAKPICKPDNFLTMCDTIQIRNLYTEIGTRGDLKRYFGIDPDEYTPQKQYAEKNNVCLCAVHLEKLFEDQAASTVAYMH